MRIIIFSLTLVLCISCQHKTDRDKAKAAILQTEKEYNKMVREKGSGIACPYFADEKAVIKGQNESLITGKLNIKEYYDKRDSMNITVDWAPDFVDVSECGTLGYTYGKFAWIRNDTILYRGVYSTVWKKQKDNSWKYVYH